MRYATGDEIDTMSIDEFLDGIAVSGTLPMHIEGKVDADSKYITGSYYVDDYMAEGYGFTVPET